MEIIEVTSTAADYLTAAASLESSLQSQGVEFSAAGGVSALPVINGFMGDRILVSMDGASITAACGNQMNPPLSYLFANQVKSAKVLPAISPVSKGGDNIAGVIAIDTIKPQYSDSSAFSWQRLLLSSQYRTNDNAKIVDVNAEAANRNWYAAYAGGLQKAQSYEDGNGNIVLDTLFEAQNHAWQLAFHDDIQQVAIKLTHQAIPYQGFANQYMDMTDNRSWGFTTRYQRTLGKTELRADASWHKVDHEMGFFTSEKPGQMPMVTQADNFTLALHWNIPFGEEGTLNVGQEYHLHTLDDFWPAIPGSMMMGPDDYININDGRRQRLGGYVEWEQPLSTRWSVNAGTRIEQVSTSTGDVQPYSSMPVMGMPNVDFAAAQAFNDQDRERADNHVDFTLVNSFRLGSEQVLQLGIARKNRAPNLYERYTWGRGTMATNMIGWFGDGNGYVGDVDLAKETAHTLAATYLRQNEQWEISSSVWYTKVSDYIDGDVIDTFESMGLESGRRNVLQFVNLDATLKGGEMNWKWQGMVTDTGKWFVSAGLKAQQGERNDSGEPLYQIPPLISRVSLAYEWLQWRSALSWQWTAAKEDVDPRRLENTTDSYQLVDWDLKWQWQQLTLMLSATNILNEDYDLPLGGVNIAQFKVDPQQGFRQISGRGRAFAFGFSFAFQ